MREVRLGLEQGFDLSKYLDTHNHHQIHQIRLGLESGLDVSLFDDARYKQAHMAEIRSVNEIGYDIAPLLDPDLSIEEVRSHKEKMIMEQMKKQNSKSSNYKMGH
jgi:hypothetical protein